MLKHFLTTSFLLIAFLTSAQNSNEYLYECSKGLAKIESDAQLELIRASSEEVQGLIEVEKRSFAFKIRIRSIKGFNSPLQQEHF